MLNFVSFKIKAGKNMWYMKYLEKVFSFLRFEMIEQQEGRVGRGSDLFHFIFPF